jgi:hypothetical protein
MKRLRFVTMVLLAIGFAALAVFRLLPRRDPKLERLIGWRHTRFRDSRQAAIEREVVEAELASYGTELIPAFRQELNSGSLWRTKPSQWLETSSPTFIAHYIAQKHFESDRRRELAVLCLGRIGPRANAAIPDIKSLVIAGGRVGINAEIALAMVARQDPTIQGGAIAALTSTSQPRRFAFMSHANEIWPDRIDLCINGLKEEDDSVRAHALQSLGSAGISASNSAPLLLSMLADSSLIVRPKAAFALGMVAPDFAETAVASMIDQRKTNFSWTGDSAYVLYQTVGPAAKAAVPALEADLSDTSMLMFHGDAAAALWRITGKMSPAIANGLDTGLRIGVQRTQIRCLRIVKEIGPPAAATIPELRRMTNHPLVLIRRLASEALESVERAGNASPTNHQTL